MIHVYGIVRQATVLSAPIKGIDGQPVETLGIATVSALVSRHPGGTGEVAIDRLLAHEHVVESAAGEGAVVPVRYGTSYGSDAHLHADLQAASDRLLSLLDRVSGRVELSLRVSAPHAAQGKTRVPAGSAGGRGYMQALCEAAIAADAPTADLAALREAVAAARPWAVAVDLATSGDARASFLVDRKDVEAVRAALAGHAAPRDGFGFVLTGPWPPYSFVVGCQEGPG